MVFGERGEHGVVRGHHHSRRVRQLRPDRARVLVAQEHRFDGVGAVEDFVHDQQRRRTARLLVRARAFDELFDAPDLRLEQRFGAAVVDRVQVPTHERKRCPAHCFGAHHAPRLREEHVQQQRFEHRGLAARVAAREHDVLVQCEVVCGLVVAQLGVERVRERERRRGVAVDHNVRFRKGVGVQQLVHGQQRVHHAHFAHELRAQVAHVGAP